MNQSMKKGCVRKCLRWDGRCMRESLRQWVTGCIQWCIRGCTLKGDIPPFHPHPSLPPTSSIPPYLLTIPSTLPPPYYPPPLSPFLPPSLPPSFLLPSFLSPPPYLLLAYLQYFPRSILALYTTCTNIFKHKFTAIFFSVIVSQLTSDLVWLKGCGNRVGLGVGLGEGLIS